MNLPVNVSTSGNTTLVAAPTGATQFIRVIGYVLTAGSSVKATFSGSPTTGNTTGPLNFGANVNIVSSVGFDLAPGDALVLNLTAAVQISGHISYVIIGG